MAAHPMNVESAGTTHGTVTASARYELPPHIYLCRFSRAAVLLDLKRNRYFGIDACDADELVTLLGASQTSVMQANEAARPARWIERGLLEITDAPSHPFSSDAIGQHGLLTAPATLHNGERPSIRLRDAAHFTLACLHAQWALRERPLWDIACNLRASAPRATESNTPTALTRTTLRFRRLRPLAFTAREQCLFHALALTHFLRAAGLASTWIIGVRLHPWGAHSWVQHGSMILDATPESVHEFRPIIAV
jgi:hypothetical protein